MFFLDMPKDLFIFYKFGIVIVIYINNKIFEILVDISNLKHC